MQQQPKDMNGHLGSSGDETGTGQAFDLHAAIMNLPCIVPANRANSSAVAYQQGHRDARHAAAELAAELMERFAANGLISEDRAILEAVHREMDRTTDGANAPGHCHETPGIWDSDNGPLLAGQPCAWCLTWVKFTRLVSRDQSQTKSTSK